MGKGEDDEEDDDEEEDGDGYHQPICIKQPGTVDVPNALKASIILAYHRPKTCDEVSKQAGAAYNSRQCVCLKDVMSHCKCNRIHCTRSGRTLLGLWSYQVYLRRRLSIELMNKRKIHL